MLTVGFKKAYFGLIDEDTDMLTGDKPTDQISIPGAKNGIYEMNAGSVLGVLSAAITGMAPTVNKIYGSDVQVDISGQGVGNISVTFAANNIPMDVESIITGYTKNSMGGWYLDNTSRAPYGALDLVASNRDGQPIHIAFLKGRFAPAEKTLTSNNDSPQWSTDSLTFSAISRNNTDLRAVTRYIEDGTTIKLDDILKDVFMGYTPDATSTTGSTTGSTAGSTTPASH